jgi:hypothetical protein
MGKDANRPSSTLMRRPAEDQPNPDSGRIFIDHDYPRGKRYGVIRAGNHPCILSRTFPRADDQFVLHLPSPVRQAISRLRPPGETASEGHDSGRRQLTECGPVLFVHIHPPGYDTPEQIPGRTRQLAVGRLITLAFDPILLGFEDFVAVLNPRRGESEFRFRFVHRLHDPGVDQFTVGWQPLLCDRYLVVPNAKTEGGDGEFGQGNGFHGRIVMRRGRGENGKPALLKIGTRGRISPDSNPSIGDRGQQEMR